MSMVARFFYDARHESLHLYKFFFDKIKDFR